MVDVKIYKEVNPQNRLSHFSISKMETSYEKRHGKADVPHRHDFYTVLIVNSAEGEHHIDFNQYALGQQQLFFVSPGQVHQVIEHSKPKGYVLTFSHLFLFENGIDQSFIDSLNLFQDYGQSPPLEPKETEFKAIQKLVKQIYKLHHSDKDLKSQSIGAYLKLILIACNNICCIDPVINKHVTSDVQLLRNFKVLVDRHYKLQHSATYYADQLNITPDHLNRVIKGKTGKTTKGYIQSRIVTEAKRQLYFTDHSTKTIAYDLGFQEAANFSAFFKKCTGYSPTQFLKAVQ